MQDELADILRIIALPLENARKLIKGEIKFILQSNLLCRINKILDLVESTPSEIIIYHTDRKKLASFEELLNKIPKLVISQRSIYSHNEIINIKRFKKLRCLELIRVPLDKIQGLNVLKPQLEYFVCDHCGNTEIITKTGKLQWSELVTFKLKNSPVNMDQHFFVSMPWIQHLELTFVNLKQLDALHCLDNLKFLNISFNHLEKLPALSPAAYSQLQILLINHNYLQDLQGIQLLSNLRGLDLSWNWISDHRSLSPLLSLKTLQWINMSNTPLSFNKHYRLYLASSIGSSAAARQFVIDSKGLSKKEQEVMGTGLGIIRCGKALYNSSNNHIQDHGIAPNYEYSMKISITNSNEISSSHDSNIKNMSTPSSSGTQSCSSSAAKNRQSANRKPSKIREVVILDLSQGGNEDSILNIGTTTNDENVERLFDREEETKPEPVENKLEKAEFIAAKLAASEEFLNNELKIENIVNNFNIPIVDDDKSISNNNITLGVVEVEIHDSRLFNSPKKISEPDVNSDIIADIQASQNFILKEQNNEDQFVCDSTIKYSVPEEHFNHECLSIHENMEILNINDNNEPQQSVKSPNKTNEGSDYINNLIKNLNRSEDVDSLTDSHQDDQEYFSANEDKDKSKTFSSMDSDLACSNESISSKDNHHNEQSSSVVEDSVIKSGESLLQLESESLTPKVIDNLEKNMSKMEIDQDSDSSSSLNMEDEFWHVQIVDNENNTARSLLLVLLENEIKEKNPVSGRTISKWYLDSVQSCVKIKTEPFTVDLEFDCLDPEKQKRTYIMEFSDAQVLIKRMYDILESRPLSAMNQSTYSCSKCQSIFVHNSPNTSAAKGFQVSCTVCSSSTVTLMDEPRPPQVKLPNKPINHSSSLSSIALGRDKDDLGHTTPSSTSKISCSAASFDQEQKSNAIAGGTITPRKYESDIEIISNPSQSSVEILDDSYRSQGNTPCRKRSSEERQIAAIPQLGTVLEVNAQLSALTESSSSGSLTESVVTTYESHNQFNKKIIAEECLVEDSREGSPNNELTINTSQGTLCEENGNVTQAITSNTADLYSFHDFKQIDPRIQIFLNQTIFDENEELLLLAKCHLWKTGGIDYDACVVFSTLRLYFFSHSLTKFESDTCNWLTLNDKFSLKSINKISPMIWHQGTVLNIQNITYLILLMDQERTNNFIKFLEGLSLKELKIQNNVNTKNEYALQRAIKAAILTENTLQPVIVLFSICLKISINKAEDEDIIRLGGLAVTNCQFHVLPGDLSWLCSNFRGAAPNVVVTQQITNLIEVERRDTILILRFLDEKDAIEEIWTFTLASLGQTLFIIDSIKSVWESLFFVPLHVSVK